MPVETTKQCVDKECISAAIQQLKNIEKTVNLEEQILLYEIEQIKKEMSYAY